jgi:hypothetical protein
MKAHNCICSFVALGCVLIGASFSPGQTTQPAPVQTKPAAGTVLSAEVVEIVGTVQHKRIEETAWQQTKVGQVLSPGMEVRTGIGSKAQVKLHETALLQINNMTRIAITELLRLKDLDKMRINISYGQVIGGILQEKVRSDFQIISPTAVLTREGTWGFEFTYDPATGDYRIRLDTDGLVRVVQTATGRRIGLRPGQYVTQAMQQWITTALFQEMVSLLDPFGVTQIEKLNYALNSGGLSGANPTGGRGSVALTKSQAGISAILTNVRQSRAQIRQLATNQTIQQAIQRALQRQEGGGEIIKPDVFSYRYGNFGTHLSNGVPPNQLFQNLPVQKTAK